VLAIGVANAGSANEKARNDKTLQAFSLLAAAAGLDLFDAIVDLNPKLVILQCTMIVRS